MSEKELNKIIAKNITELLKTHGKNQSDLADYLGVTQTTVSNWCRGEKTPRMKKIDMICDYFSINRSDLMEDKGEQEQSTYYLNKETKKIAQEIFENKELRLLFDAGKDVSPEDLKLVHDMLIRMKRSGVD
ncbi:MAG: helix-turn-helix transcriptional regulator [Anaerostipes sp.]|jgi:transcriptional regulator with XRE-family HTH domain|nr:helix-turn-helix transcriptional regulator [Anaerostipes sp.]